jgi:hypothetical protein
VVTFADKETVVSESSGACYYDEAGNRSCFSGPVDRQEAYPFPSYTHYGPDHVFPLRGSVAFKSARKVINGGQVGEPAFGMCKLPGTETPREQTCRHEPSTGVTTCSTKSDWKWTVSRTRLEQVFEGLAGSSMAAVRGLDFGYLKGSRYTEVFGADGSDLLAIDYDFAGSLPILGESLSIDANAEVGVACSQTSGGPWLLKIRPAVTDVSASLYDVIPVEIFTGEFDDRLDLKELGKPLQEYVPFCPRISFNNAGQLLVEGPLAYDGRSLVGPLCESN